jgi:NAD+ kinase
MRHAESEGNVALRAAKNGRPELLAAILSAHSSEWRLSAAGREQARRAGVFIRERLGATFQRQYVSEYVRALETALLLELPDPRWEPSPYLCERDWGFLDSLPIDERERRFAEELSHRERNAFFWRPPHGESLAEVTLRCDWFLSRLAQECGAEDRVLVVCHEEVMWSCRIVLESLPVSTLAAAVEGGIENCEILHYRRTGPADTSGRRQCFDALRRIVPSTGDCSDWEQIVAPRRLGRGELEALVHEKPQLLDAR